MFNVGGPEILVILLVALVVLGPDQLPKAMRTFGNVMAEIRKVSGGFQDEMRKAMETLDTTGADTTDKPMSHKPPSGQPDEVTASSSNGEITEVVARNTDAPDPLAATDPVPHRPPVDPADRAAG